MKTLLALAFLPLVGCSSLGSPDSNGKLATTHSANVVADPFPVATTDITVHVDEKNPPQLSDLLSQLEKATGVHLLISREAEQVLRHTPTGLTHDLEIPREGVWTTVETILLQNDFVLASFDREQPRILAVMGIQGNNANRQSVRMSANYVTREELRVWAKHPAFLVTTVITLDATDVRTLSNTMRTMFVDANTQQIIPVGNSNSLILTGFASNVAAMVDMLERCNDDERKRLADEAKKAPLPGSDATKPAAK